ncbi:MAG TPA: hypothetical protein VGC32_05240 [Solirubrobacterales bacterium]
MAFWSSIEFVNQNRSGIVVGHDKQFLTNSIDMINNTISRNPIAPDTAPDQAPHERRRSGGLKLGFLTNVPFTS